MAQAQQHQGHYLPLIRHDMGGAVYRCPVCGQQQTMVYSADGLTPAAITLPAACTGPRGVAPAKCAHAYTETAGHFRVSLWSEESTAGRLAWAELEQIDRWSVIIVLCQYGDLGWCRLVCANCHEGDCQHTTAVRQAIQQHSVAMKVAPV